jgi:hypothetical protein
VLALPVAVDLTAREVQNPANNKPGRIAQLRVIPLRQQ